MTSELLGLVADAITEVAPDVSGVTSGTRLIGESAVVDSIGFVTLLIAIEQRLDGRVDLAQTFQVHGAEDAQGNPFQTVGSLVEYLAGATGGR